MTTTASIEPLLERLLGGQPLSADQRGALVASKDLLALGMAADELRRRRHGDDVTFVRVATIDVAQAAAPAWDGQPGEVRLTGAPRDLDRAVAAVHALAYPVGGHFHVPHGLSNALMLPHVLRFNLEVPGAAEHYAELAPVLLPGKSFSTPSAGAGALLAELEAIIDDVKLEKQLRQVGIEAIVKQVESAQYFPALARRDYQIGANLTASGIDDPDGYLFENYKCGASRNYTDYCSEAMDRLIDQQSGELDRAKRLKLVWDIQRRLEAEVARPMLGWRNEYFTHWPYVKNLLPQNSLYNYARMQEVWLDK